MKEYIERAHVLKFMNALYEHHLAMRNYSADGATLDCMSIVKNAPAADVVEVVRCKDCRHMTLEMGYVRFCNVWERPNGMGDDGFCNYGELREDA